MKYIAIVDDEFLTNFRVDVGYPPHSDMILVVNDERGFARGIQLKPIAREMVVARDGNSLYLNQDHIDCLLEMERKQMFDKAVKDIIEGFRNEDYYNL